MHVVILAAVIVSLLMLEVPSLTVPWWAVPAALAGYLCVLAVATWRNTARALGALRGDGSPSAALRRHHRVGVLTCAWMVLGSGGLVALGYGRWICGPGGLGLGRFPLVDKLLVMAPFLAALVLYWLLEYPFHAAVRRRVGRLAPSLGFSGAPKWSLREYLVNNARHQLLFLAVPVGLILLIQDVVTLYVADALPAGIRENAVIALTLGGAAIVFVLAPLLIVRIWRTERLPSGHLRSELEDVCRRLKLRYRDLLVWRSGGVIVNAGVVGVVPAVRYVLLSDALLDQADPRHIRAIFGHEAGHILHRHVFYSAMFAVVSVVACASAAEAVGTYLHWAPWIAEGAAALLLALTWWLLFGWISRRFERQCDVTGAWVIGDSTGRVDPEGRISPHAAMAFATALENVAILNGIPPRQPSWRHGSIAARVSYLMRLAARGGSRGAVDRVVRRVQRALWVALAAAAALVAWQLTWQ